MALVVLYLRGFLADRDFGAIVPARARFTLPLVGVGVLGSGHSEGNGKGAIGVPRLRPKFKLVANAIVDSKNLPRLA